MKTNRNKTIRIATRKSRLALWQSEHVRKQLQRVWPELTVELLPMSTKGDEILDRPLAEIGGKGLFLKELERALLNNEADLAVHSLKDVPAESPEGLRLAAFLPRADAEDVWITRDGTSLEQLPPGSRIGSSSLRRMSQLCAIRQDLDLVGLRGNVETRLNAVYSGKVDATILAAAGLRRLEIEPEQAIELSLDHWLPAPGQGVIGIQCRAEDQQAVEWLQRIHCQTTAHSVMAERAVIETLGGDCRMPLAAFAVLDDGEIHLRAKLGDRAGNMIEAHSTAALEHAEYLGCLVAQQLLDQGGDEIIAGID